MINVQIKSADFNIAAEIKKLKSHSVQTGAIVSFLGCVRDLDNSQNLASLTLEHYPSMTEKTITSIIEQAHKRWNILATTTIHRIGKLKVNDNIVLVACSAKHRRDAFLAAEFIMDFLKTDAPFWKKTQTKDGVSYWAGAKQTNTKNKLKWDN